MLIFLLLRLYASGYLFLSYIWKVFWSFLTQVVVIKQKDQGMTRSKGNPEEIWKFYSCPDRNRTRLQTFKMACLSQEWLHLPRSHLVSYGPPSKSGLWTSEAAEASWDEKDFLKIVEWTKLKRVNLSNVSNYCYFFLSFVPSRHAGIRRQRRVLWV